MNAMATSAKAGGGGCGCGGAGGCGCGGRAAAQCASGDAGCATCNEQGFSRPLFFAGQLLTEEDLGALGDYVVGKSRLHNRRLFGDGVVCGLEVMCDPCGGGKVVVQPGYALDCCGNDLLLACPTELDVNAMARDLRRNLLGGSDCGDPCADRRKKRREECQPEEEEPAPSGTATQPGSGATAGAVVGTPAPPAGQPPAGQTPAAETLPDTLRHYCLYARYCEEQTDPVSPYATDDACAFQACQPTRVREGVSFELRCRACACPPEDILTRLCACVGDLRVAEENARRAAALGAFARLSAQPQRLYAAKTLTTADAVRAGTNFVKSVEALRLSPIIVRPAAGATKAAVREGVGLAEAERPTPEPSVATAPAAPAGGPQVERAVLAVRDAATHLAAYYAATEAAGAPAEGAPSAEELAAARRELLRTAEAARASLGTIPTASPEYTYSVSLLERVEGLARSESPATEIGPDELRAMRAGIYLNAQARTLTLQRARALREALLDALDASPRIGDCGLRRDVRAVRLPASDEDVEALRAASAALVEAWRRHLLDCGCMAFNPPCAKCDDPAVLLACLVVDEATCEVVEICNLKRKFVISPAALRYWLPPLNWLGNLVEELCCGAPLCGDEEEEEAAQGRDTTFTPRSNLSVYERFPTRRDISDDFLRGIIALCGGKREREAVRPQPGDTAGFSPTGGRVSAYVRNTLRTFVPTPPPAEFVTEAVKDPAARAELLRALGPELKKGAPTREELTASIEREVRERMVGASSTPEFRRSVAETLKAEEVSAGMRELVERLAAAAQPDDAAIERKIEERVAAALGKLKPARESAELKRVKTENTELKKGLAALEERLKKVEGRA